MAEEDVVRYAACAQEGGEREQLGAGRQVILTAVDRASLEAAWGEEPLSLFHVEQGRMLPA